MFSFKIKAISGNARTGILTTPHGEIRTPAFVAVGTLGTVKSLSAQDLEDLGIQVIIANTYHLHLQPGEGLIQELGGLHKFMGWNGPIMTDSGGFQIFSHGAGKEHGVGKVASIFPEESDRGGHLTTKKGKSLVKIDEGGAQFVSYLDGSIHRFTPESVIEIQKKIGADIILPLDECTSPLHDYQYTKQAMERTHRWAQRALEAFYGAKGPAHRQAIFGIVQGGAYQDLREQSSTFIGSMEFHGFAIGGSLGKSKSDMYNVLDWTIPLLPSSKPRHLLGIGEIEDIFEIVKRGVDLFDCVAPTRTARTGVLFVRGEPRNRIHILNSRFRSDPRPIDESCTCSTCLRYSRAYIRHLFAAKELLGIRLATIHNLSFIQNLMKEIRGSIESNTFPQLATSYSSLP